MGLPPFEKGGIGGILLGVTIQSATEDRSRFLRTNLTDAELRLWYRLRRQQILGIQFYRQKPIGNYIVDFYAPAAKLVIEVDGAQHLDLRQAKYDAQRTRYIEEQGLKVLRFDDREVLLQTESVL